MQHNANGAIYLNGYAQTVADLFLNLDLLDINVLFMV